MWYPKGFFGLEILSYIVVMSRLGSSISSLLVHSCPECRMRSSHGTKPTRMSWKCYRKSKKDFSKSRYMGEKVQKRIEWNYRRLREKRHPGKDWKQCSELEMHSRGLKVCTPYGFLNDGKGNVQPYMRRDYQRRGFAHLWGGWVTDGVKYYPTASVYEFPSTPNDDITDLILRTVL